MEKSLTELKPDEDQVLFKCSGCNGTFRKPILATVSSSGHVQTYYACPYCLTKVAGADGSRENGDAEVEHENALGCKHFLGYLRQRPRDVSIPDECLVCEKMVDCLLH